MNDSINGDERLRGDAEATYDKAKESARALGREAKGKAAEYAESQKGRVSESLEDFAEAIERAGEELKERDQTLVGELAHEAASSLGQLSRSISGSSTSEIVDSVRRFGRNNPAAFLGGAVLAGLALGRFARAAPEQTPERDEFNTQQSAAFSAVSSIAPEDPGQSSVSSSSTRTGGSA